MNSASLKKIKEYAESVRGLLAKNKGQNGDAETNGSVRGMFFRLSLQEQMLFAKRLSILLKSGIPILQALNMLQRQSQSRTARVMLADLCVGVEGGQYLHVRLEKYRKYFGDFAVNIVRIGEVSGTLHENLSYLAEEIKKKKELKRKVFSALVYPAFIILATIGITIMLITYVFPKILPVLQTMKGTLPFTTRSLIFLSHLFSTQGWLMALVVVVVVGAWIFLMRKMHGFRFWAHKSLLMIPLVKKLFIDYHVANFCRTLGILLKSDVRIVEAVGITATTSGNLAYQDAVMQVNEAGRRGEKISVVIETFPGLFPPMVAQMITVGETTGKLADSLLFLADIYEQEVDDLTKDLSTTIEPLLMVFMGLLVGFIAMSIITPIYSLTQSLSR